MKRIILTTLAALALLASPQARAWTYSDGDVLLIFRNGSQDVEFDLGSVTNYLGKTNGYTVPNPIAQARLVADALDRAGVSARSISYLEAHGTGTALTKAGLTKADAGSVRVNGQDLAVLGDKALTLFRRRNIGLVFQEPTLDGYLTAEQNLRFHAALYGMPAATMAAISAAMAAVPAMGLVARKASSPVLSRCDGTSRPASSTNPMRYT